MKNLNTLAVVATHRLANNAHVGAFLDAIIRISNMPFYGANGKLRPIWVDKRTRR